MRSVTHSVLRFGISFGALCRVLALSVVLTLALGSAAFAQLLPGPTLSIDDVTVTEGDAGTTNATFTVTRSGDQTLVSTVNFATADNTATQPGDYASVYGILVTFDPGETTESVTVSVNGDTVDEGSEKFFVNLETPVNATIEDSQGVGTITDDDDTPQANDDGSAATPITLVEDDPTGVTTDVLANDTGLGDTPITVEVTGPPSKGTATVNADKTITYKPNANENGPDTYNYTVTDSDNETSTAAVYLQITPVNDATTIGSVTNSGPVSEGSPATITVTATDVEGDTLSYEFDCNNDNAFEIGPQPANKAQCAFNDGTRRVNVRVSDGGINPATGFTDVTVNNVAPNAVDDAASAREGGLDVVIDILANDTDVSGDTLTITGNTQPPAGEGSVSCSTNTCTFTPHRHFNGTTSFGYTISDGDGGTATATVTVTVAAVNDPPSFTKGADQNVQEDAGAQSVPNWATGISPGPADEAGQAVSFTVTNDNNALFAAQPAVSSDGTLTYTPAANASGTANVEVVAQDNGETANGGDDAGAPQTFTIAVNGVNDAPTADTQSVTTSEDAAKMITLAGSDADGENVTFVITEGPSDGSLDTIDPPTCAGTAPRICQADVIYTPNANYNGSDTFKFRVNDGTANSSEATATVTVNPVNDAPVAANDDAYSTDEDVALDLPAPGVLGNDTDVDPDPLTARLVTGPQHGTLQLRPDGSFTYTPNNNFSGTDTFTYRANDGPSDSDEAAVTITVRAVNDEPVAVDDTATPYVDGSVDINVKGNDTDPDGDILTVAGVSDPPHGTATINPDNTVRYVPDADYNGPDSFTYTVSDGNGGTATASVDVTVTPVADSVAPRVTTPLPVGKKVSPKANVTTKFSEAMDASTLSNAQGRSTTFVLTRKGVAVSATVVYDDTTDTAILDPGGNLKRRATYMVTVTTGVEDAAGNALDQDPNTAGNQSMAWSFRVRR